MFDIAFSELIIIAVVALIIIGPERLPKVARTAGHLLGRLQRYVSDVKADINREMQLEELKKLQAEVQESARSFERSVSSVGNEMQLAEHALKQTAQGVADEVEPLAANAADAASLPDAQLETSAPHDAAAPAGKV